MKTIINEEIKRIQELMGLEKSLINEQWWKVIDDLIRVTKKTDNFYRSIAMFGGKSVDELERALTNGENILQALGKNENEFASFIKGDKILFKKFANEFVANDINAISIEKTYMDEISKLTTKEDIDTKLRELILTAKSDNKLGDAAVLQNMYDNIGNISIKSLKNTIGNQFKTVDEFINSTQFKNQEIIVGLPKNVKNSLIELVKNNWNRIKNLDISEYSDFITKNWLKPGPERDLFERWVYRFKNTPFTASLSAVGLLALFTSLGFLAICVTKHRGDWMRCITRESLKKIEGAEKGIKDVFPDEEGGTEKDKKDEGGSSDMSSDEEYPLAP